MVSKGTHQPTATLVANLRQWPTRPWQEVACRTTSATRRWRARLLGRYRRPMLGVRPLCAAYTPLAVEGQAGADPLVMIAAPLSPPKGDRSACAAHSGLNPLGPWALGDKIVT